ncbi:uncharacterized protein [Anabrus simplex]|uniref:uncharacterized protein n=1 Tax=Anabrus simplex TaxID=316456 RepID=UPI0035A290FD
MAPYGYVQLFLFGVLCIGAVIAENATCTNPRALNDIDMDKVYGDWFVGKWYGPFNFTYDRSRCFSLNITKVNETTFEMIMETPSTPSSKIFTIEDSENAGIWFDVDIHRTVQVIYQSADGTAMALAFCVENETDPALTLLSKQVPVSPEKIAEFLHAQETAGMLGHNHRFKWDSGATCPSA